ncbi:MAG: hypothetical protein KDA61_08865, partial [Planctomycetales bacterium]|nr:hypothetical protein [Planctomycetales bacterium]
HHPRQHLWKNKEKPPRVAAAVLEAAQTNSSGIVADYRDPLSEDPEARFVGAFEKVFFSVPGESEPRPTDWIVLVQQPMIP